jgi:hypothetical protein
MTMTPEEQAEMQAQIRHLMESMIQLTNLVQRLVSIQDQMIDTMDKLFQMVVLK